jgi:hypothetical protein
MAEYHTCTPDDELNQITELQDRSPTDYRKYRPSGLTGFGFSHAAVAF